MGTSVSQSSPRSAKWKPVHLSYTNENIPEDKILNEVWRAADNPTEEVRWSDEIKSDIIYSCLKTVDNSTNFQEALAKFNDVVFKRKNNSIAAELAKRSIPIAFQGQNPTNDWVNRFFSEVTSYVISRDLSGFVGSNYRNKNVADLNSFKNRINTNLTKVLESKNINIKSKKGWMNYVDDTISKLKESS